MTKDEALQKALSMPILELLPSKFFEGEVHQLTKDEFDQLRTAMGISDYRMREYGYNIIIIGNTVFHKEQ
jgi:hypothetical protein